MEKVYPYTLDEHLKKAIKIAMGNGDDQMAASLWNLFISYRKSTLKVPNV